jgi:hypothetical protein
MLMGESECRTYEVSDGEEDEGADVRKDDL